MEHTLQLVSVKPKAMGGADVDMDAFELLRHQCRVAGRTDELSLSLEIWSGRVHEFYFRV